MEELLSVILQDERVKSLLVEKFMTALEDYVVDEEMVARCLNAHVKDWFQDGEFYDIVQQVGEQALRKRFGIEEDWCD